MDYSKDSRVVLTLDAGGTNFIFSAMQYGKFIAEPYSLPSNADNLGMCLAQLVKGFEHVKRLCPETPCAISFAFPGPADYERGVIGDLPNFPSFRGGVALGPFLESKFDIPVFINNDGALFAYGEAMNGALPEINNMLKQCGSTKVYKHLLGITLGTGFGCGAVIGGKLLMGDNGLGGSIWCFRNKKYSDHIIEESVAIRAIKRVYKELSNDARELTPKDIAAIAKGKAEGDVKAARLSFAELGEMAGDAIAMADTVIDGVVVVGGGLVNSADLIFPALVDEMNSKLKMMNGCEVGHMQAVVYNLEDPKSMAEFCKMGTKKVRVPGTDHEVEYQESKRIGVIRSRFGTSESISLGAYVFALNKLDE
uniref:ROK family protein n=1 Tax=Prevotella sp. GTC17259 TaxID=3236795 RepID=A0AB33JAQ3_9BACT